MVTSTVNSPSLPLVVVDASVWVSRLLPSDVNHVAACDWIRNHVTNGGRIVAPTLLVAEIAGTLSRVQQNSQLARAAVTQLYQFSWLKLVPMDQAVVEETVNVAIAFCIKGADAFYVAVAATLGVPLVTFDLEQLHRPSSLITTIRP